MVQVLRLANVREVAALEDDAVLAALAYEVGEVERRVDAQGPELAAGGRVGWELGGV